MGELRRAEQRVRLRERRHAPLQLRRHAASAASVAASASTAARPAAAAAARPAAARPAAAGPAAAVGGVTAEARHEWCEARGRRRARRAAGYLPRAAGYPLRAPTASGLATEVLTW